MRQSNEVLEIATAGKGLVEISWQVRGFSEGQGMASGLLTLFCRHTSASLLIQENAAPAARRDLEAFFERIAPEGADYEHDDEGPDDMPAHLRSALTSSSLSVPLVGGRLALGRWQGIYLFEHRSAAQRREVVLHLIGD
ncbi:secondary thiamine-phosphate synthase enzyme YjbQ [Sphingomonas mesophila]|uniref:secondary thiamine-phosphate synthase enzyme YjbQ n=1 Tax=Sphingomonas mesophila TaxID=2303576 RepID=UPI000E57E13D|nr:secondary thiamine-phosphate synthase enzyme YjbQ [Sphingomonas mesophila]